MLFRRNVNCIVNFVKSRNETRASSANERQVYESNNLMAYTAQIWLTINFSFEFIPEILFITFEKALCSHSIWDIIILNIINDKSMINATFIID